MQLSKNIWDGSSEPWTEVSGGTSGGIFGMVSPINPTKAENEIQVTNCFFLTSAGGNNGYGTGMAADEMKTEQFKNQLDQSSHSFVMDNGTNEGYPIHGLSSFILMEVSEVTCHAAKLSAWIHQGNANFARAIFFYQKFDSGAWIEVDVPTDGYVETVLEDLEEDTDYVFDMEIHYADGGLVAWGLMFFRTGYDMADENSSEAAVYPNPVTDFAYIQGVETMEAQVFNALGQRVLKAANATEINVGDLSEGLYLPHITTDSWKVIERRIAVK